MHFYHNSAIFLVVANCVLVLWRWIISFNLSIMISLIELKIDFHSDSSFLILIDFFSIVQGFHSIGEQRLAYLFAFSSQCLKAITTIFSLLPMIFKMHGNLKELSSKKFDFDLNNWKFLAFGTFKLILVLFLWVYFSFASPSQSFK